MKQIAMQVRRLRVSKKWTQQQLATTAGVSRPTISALEAPDSSTMPSMRTLAAVAGAFGVDVADLMRDIELPTHVRFRALTTFKSREQVLADAMKAYENYRTLERAVGKNLQGKFNLEQVRQELQQKSGDQKPLQAAQLLRGERYLGLPNTVPLPRIVEVIEQFGVRIISMPYNTDAFGLSFVSSEGFPVIVINVSERITIERRIFSAAHELGHLLLHNEFEDTLDVLENEKEEHEANRFAAELLMPQAGFEQVQQVYSASTLLEQVLEIKRRFIVSYQAVIFRLSKSKEHYKELLDQFHMEYEFKFGTSLSGIEECKFPAGWEKYDVRLVPVSQTSQEPENIGAGAPRAEAFFPQGRALQLLFEGIRAGKLSEEEVANILYTSRPNAVALMKRVSRS